MSKNFAWRRCMKAMVVAAAISPGLAAADWYAGVGIGKGDAGLDRSTLGSPSFSEDDGTWKVFGGYQYNENLAVEFGYHDLGSVRWYDPSDEVEAKFTALEISAVGIMPLGTNWSLLGKAGLANWTVDVDSSFGDSDKETGSDLMYGVGFSYSFSKSSEVRFFYEVVSAESGDFDIDTDVKNMSLSYVGHF